MAEVDNDGSQVDMNCIVDAQDVGVGEVVGVGEAADRNMEALAAHCRSDNNYCNYDDGS